MDDRLVAQLKTRASKGELASRYAEADERRGRVALATAAKGGGATLGSFSLGF